MLLRTLSTRHWRKMIPKRCVKRNWDLRLLQPTVWSKFPGHDTGGGNPDPDSYSLRVVEMMLGALGWKGGKSSQGSIGREDRAACRESLRIAMFLLEDSLNSWPGHGCGETTQDQVKNLQNDNRGQCLNFTPTLDSSCSL